MKKQKFLDFISFFETGLSVAEWTWRIATLLFIGGSGTVTAFIAKTDPILKDLGPIYWIAIGIFTSFIVSVILYFIKSANLKQAEADFARAMATPRSSINPLSDNFQDSIIPVEDLRLPTLQLHENKHFIRCKFVGPASIAILGGSYIRSNFNTCGDIIALPENVSLTGIIILKNCTVEDCEFIRTTIFADQNTARVISAVPGATVKGIST